MFSLLQAGTWGFDDTLKMHPGRIACHARLMRQRSDLCGVKENCS